MLKHDVVTATRPTDAPNFGFLETWSLILNSPFSEKKKKKKKASAKGGLLKSQAPLALNLFSH